MTQQTIVQREIIIRAPLTHVWHLVSTEEGLRQWWGNPIFLEAKEGGRCEEWRPSQTRTTRWQGVVTLYMPPHQLMLTLRAAEAQGHEPEMTTISIALEARGDATSVHVTQRAFGARAVIATPRESVPQTTPQPDMPLAQWVGAAPGARPATATPGTTNTPTQGSAQPLDALTQTWQQRLTSLAATFTKLQ